MFDKTGESIKTLAGIFGTIGIIIGVIGWLVFMIALSGSGGFWIGLLFMVVISLTSWISSLLLHGFGEIVDTAEYTKQILAEIEEDREKEQILVEIKKDMSRENEKNNFRADKRNEWECVCGLIHKNYVTSCYNCGKSKHEALKAQKSE